MNLATKSVGVKVEYDSRSELGQRRITLHEKPSSVRTISSTDYFFHANWLNWIVGQVCDFVAVDLVVRSLLVLGERILQHCCSEPIIRYGVGSSTYKKEGREGRYVFSDNPWKYYKTKVRDWLGLRKSRKRCAYVFRGKCTHLWEEWRRINCSCKKNKNSSRKTYVKNYSVTDTRWLIMLHGVSNIQKTSWKYFFF